MTGTPHTSSPATPASPVRDRSRAQAVETTAHARAGVSRARSSDSSSHAITNGNARAAPAPAPGPGPPAHVMIKQPRPRRCVAGPTIWPAVPPATFADSPDQLSSAADSPSRAAPPGANLVREAACRIQSTTRGRPSSARKGCPPREPRLRGGRRLTPTGPGADGSGQPRWVLRCQSPASVRTRSGRAASSRRPGRGRHAVSIERHVAAAGFNRRTSARPAANRNLCDLIGASTSCWPITDGGPTHPPWQFVKNGSANQPPSRSIPTASSRPKSSCNWNRLARGSLAGARHDEEAAARRQPPADALVP